MFDFLVALGKTQFNEWFNPWFVNMCDKPEYKPEIMQGFDLTSYTGKWYEQTHSKEFFVQPDDSVCITADYSFDDDGTFKIANTYQTGNVRNPQRGGFSERTGRTAFAECDENGQATCVVSFSGKNFKGKPNYNVLFTDYDNVSVVYNCERRTQ